MIKCYECGREISSRAKFCPHCGEPLEEREKNRLFLTFFILFFVGIIGFAIFSMSSNHVNDNSNPPSSHPAERNAAPKHPATKKTPAHELSKADIEKQKKRLEIIEDMKENNIIYKIEKLAKYPHVYVGTTFYSLDYDQKSTLMNLILSYYITEDPKSDTVILYDNRSGNNIGTFTKSGLKLK